MLSVPTGNFLTEIFFVELMKWENWRKVFSYVGLGWCEGGDLKMFARSADGYSLSTGIREGGEPSWSCVVLFQIDTKLYQKYLYFE